MAASGLDFRPLDPQAMGLQLVFLEAPELDDEAIQHFLHVHPEMTDATCELIDPEDFGEAANWISEAGPPASRLGVIAWGLHRIQLVQCNAPMPYGPIETCVLPSALPGEIKADAQVHQAHILLYYAGTDPNPFERYVALAVVAGAIACFDAIAILHEEARTAIPALDLIPDEDEDLLQTIRGLPIPYLFGGFLKLDVGDADRPYARTYTCHRLGLPDLARHLSSHAETLETFRLFAGVLGYLRAMNETLHPGESLDLGTGTQFLLRDPQDSEWFLDSPGQLLVLETANAD
jgi:hypothetical protein